jgi:hypothetical protein
MRVSIMTTTYYRSVDVSGVRFFHREAGPVDAPVLLNGFEIPHRVAVVGEKIASDGEGEPSLSPQRPALITRHDFLSKAHAPMKETDRPSSVVSMHVGI